MIAGSAADVGAPTEPLQRLMVLVDALPSAAQATSDAQLNPDYTSSRSDVQRTEHIAVYIRALAVPAERDEAAKEWFDSHLNADAVKALSFMTGVCDRLSDRG